MVKLARSRARCGGAVPSKPRLIGGAAEFCRRVADELDVLEEEVLVDVLRDNQYKADMIHPNALGYRRTARAG